MPKFMAIFALMSTGLILNPSICEVSLHLLSLSSWLNLLLTCGNLSLCLFSCCYLWLPCLDLNDFLCFLWNLLGDNSVHWCLNKFTCVACGSLDICLMCLAVDLEDSNFLASCLTLLAGNLSRSILESLRVLDTNSSSLRKKQKMIWCKILAVSCGYLAKLICAWTVLYHCYITLLRFDYNISHKDNND